MPSTLSWSNPSQQSRCRASGDVDGPARPWYVTRRLSGVPARLGHRPTWPSRTNSPALVPRRPCESYPRRFTVGRYCAGLRRAGAQWYVTGATHRVPRGVAPARRHSDRATRVRCLSSPRKLAHEGTCKATSTSGSPEWSPSCARCGILMCTHVYTDDDDCRE